MVQSLSGWDSLHHRRLLSQGTMFYKIYMGDVGISLPPDIIPNERPSRAPNCRPFKQVKVKNDINRLLTECEGRTVEYWPEVVAVRTERSEVRTATTEGQYSPVRPEQARLVSGLLYGTVSDSKMQWHSVSDNKMQLQKRFVTESDKSSC